MSFVGLTTIAVALTGYLTYRDGRTAVRDTAAQLSTEIAQQIHNRLQAQLDIPAVINELNASAISRGLLSPDDQRAMERFFAGQVRRIQATSSIYFGNTRGGLANAGRDPTDGSIYVIATEEFDAGTFRKFAIDDDDRRERLLLSVPGFDARTRPWYQRARDRQGPAWSDVYVLFTGQDMAIAASRPVIDDDGNFVGVIATDLFLSQLNDYLGSLSIGGSGLAFMLESTGVLLASSSGEAMFSADEAGGWRRTTAAGSTDPTTRAAYAHARRRIGDLAAIEAPRTFEFNWNDRYYFASVAPLGGTHGLDWRTVVVVPEEDFLAQVRSNARWTAALVLTTLMLALLAGVAGSRWISNPLVRLNAAARALSHGERTPVATSGRIREIDELSSSFNTMAGHIHELLAGLREEVAEREQARKELLRSESLYRSVVENIREIVFQLDASGRFVFLNEAWTTLTGYSVSESVSRPFPEFVHVDLRAVDQEHFGALADRRKTEHKGDSRLVRKDGGVVHVEVFARAMFDEHGAFTGAAGTLTDVTERLQVDRALRRTQKMEAIGRLSGGIAHDFNNLLAIMLGNLDLMDRRGNLNSQSKQWLASVRRSAQRAEHLTRQLLGFSGRQSTATLACSVNEIIDGMGDLLARSITPQVELRLKLADDAWTTHIDSGDFEDALLNLVINARDAMPDGGVLTIETANRTLDAAFCAVNPSATSGDHVEIAVIDTGVGIRSEHLDRIFEPFFTTKPQDKGTGLGLAMVYGFARRSGGYITVNSAPGEGTRVRLLLPRYEQDPAPAAEKTVDAGSLPGGHETILVVDDEEELCELARLLLSELGYRAVCASNANEALERLAAHPDIALLFSDIVMPGGMSGYELAEAAVAQYPGLKVLLTSGHEGEAGNDETRKRLRTDVLRKPYAASELARRVRRALDEPRD